MDDDHIRDLLTGDSQLLDIYDEYMAMIQGKGEVIINVLSEISINLIKDIESTLLDYSYLSKIATKDEALVVKIRDVGSMLFTKLYYFKMVTTRLFKLMDTDNKKEAKPTKSIANAHVIADEIYANVVKMITAKKTKSKKKQ